MFTPAQSNNHVIMDILFQSKRAARHEKVEVMNTSAWERYGRLQTLEVWQKQGRIDIKYFLNNQKDRSTAVVTFGQYERREDTSNFPSPEMVANIALALGAGADQQ